VYENILVNAGVNGKISFAEDKNKVFFERPVTMPSPFFRTP
jgi:hypothetical protein